MLLNIRRSTGTHVAASIAQNILTALLIYGAV